MIIWAELWALIKGCVMIEFIAALFQASIALGVVGLLVIGTMALFHIAVKTLALFFYAILRLIDRCVGDTKE